MYLNILYENVNSFSFNKIEVYLRQIGLNSIKNRKPCEKVNQHSQTACFVVQLNLYDFKTVFYSNQS